MEREAYNFDVLSDVALRITVELGRTQMRIADVLALGTGSLVKLDRAADAPIDIRINDTLIGRGEIVSIDDRYGVRISEVRPYRTAEV